MKNFCVIEKNSRENHAGSKARNDVAEILEADGVNVRSGHHCAQPLLAHLGCRASTRASFMFYNTEEEADRLVESLKNVRGRMGL